jgi:ribonuclease HII
MQQGLKFMEFYDLEAARLDELFRFERQLRAQGALRVAGIDEAGRGPLAGPVVAAVCVLPERAILTGLNDSKQVIAEDREKLYHQIVVLDGCDWAVGIATVAEIDRLNILRASFLAMYRALEQLQQKPDVILIDGHLAPSFGIPTVPVVKGDAKSGSIAAASILAKVTRDRLMDEMDQLFPQYGFKKNRGYATPDHLEAIQSEGPSAIHRKSFDPIKTMCLSETQGDLGF